MVGSKSYRPLRKFCVVGLRSVARKENLHACVSVRCFHFQ